jgi:hypothetical protein
MKGVAKCDKHFELQSSVSQQKLERMLRFQEIPDSTPASVPTAFASSHRQFVHAAAVTVYHCASKSSLEPLSCAIHCWCGSIPMASSLVNLFVVISCPAPLRKLPCEGYYFCLPVPFSQGMMLG